MFAGGGGGRVGGGVGGSGGGDASRSGGGGGGWAAVEVEVGMAAVRLVARVVEGRSGVRVLRVAAAAAVRAAGRLAAGMAGLADRVAVRRVVMVVASACVIV